MKAIYGGSKLGREEERCREKIVIPGQYKQGIKK